MEIINKSLQAPVQHGIHIHIQKNSSIGVTYLAISFRTCSQYSDDKYVLDVLANLLGGYFSSKLFMILREENGLTYTNTVTSNNNEFCGDFTITSISDPSTFIKNGNKKGVLPIVIDILNSIFLDEVLSIQLMYNQNPWISAQSRPRLVHVEGFYKPWKMTNFVFLFFLLIPILTDFFCLFTKGRIYSRTKIFIDYKRQEIKILNYLNMKLSKGVYSGRTPKLAMKKNLTIKLIIHHLSRRFQGDDSAIKH
jgi:hypothetical protein